MINHNEAMLETEFIPAAQKDSRRLMVVLHGLGDSSAGFRWLPEALGLPWMNYLLVNAPTPYYGGYAWYDFFGDMAKGLGRSRKLAFRIARRATRQRISHGANHFVRLFAGLPDDR